MMLVTRTAEVPLLRCSASMTGREEGSTCA